MFRLDLPLPIHRAWIIIPFVLLTALVPEAASATLPGPAEQASASPVATYSIVAFDPATGDLGVGVQSKFFGVGSVVPWAQAGVGAIATQSYANVAYGPEGLALLRGGASARETVDRLTAGDDGRARRQLAVVDARGRVAVHTGDGCQAWAGHREGDHFAVQGNLLVDANVVDAMAHAYQTARSRDGSQLADWILAALDAAQAAGGDRRGQQSAAMLVVRDRGGVWGQNDRFIDLRVEDHPRPIEELGRLLEVHKLFYRATHAQRPVRVPQPLPDPAPPAE
ncbi:MAG: DUF1028 domain-containing protein [Verrucomicrobiae bacterium]|nr:DUF1028 domain-containing protein [Verrucomicrobiae bacterium]